MKIWMAHRPAENGTGLHLVWEASEQKARKLAKNEWGDAKFSVKQVDMPTSMVLMLDWLNTNFTFRKTPD